MPRAVASHFPSVMRMLILLLALTLMLATLTACGGDSSRPDAFSDADDSVALSNGAGDDSGPQAVPDRGEAESPSAGASDELSLLGRGSGEKGIDEEERADSAPALLYVSAGFGHTCMVKLDGSVSCWGWDLNLQSRPPEGEFTSVSAGGAHTCGVRANGTVTPAW